MKPFAALAFLLFALPGFADSYNVFVVDKIVNNNQVLLQLTPNGNPLVHSVDPLGTSLTFEIENIFSSTFDLQASVTLTLGGQTIINGPLGGYICPDPQPCNIGVSLNTPFFSKPVQGSVAWTISGQTEKFNFRYTSIPASTPEPTTFLLLGTGLAAVGWCKYRSSAVGRPR
jgi:hypothetical protein